MHDATSREQPSSAPFNLDPSNWIKMRVATQVTIIGALISGVLWAGHQSWTISQHSEQIAEVKTELKSVGIAVAADHEQLRDIQSEQKIAAAATAEMIKKLDYLTGARRERPPAGTPVAPTQ